MILFPCLVSHGGHAQGPRIVSRKMTTSTGRVVLWSLLVLVCLGVCSTGLLPGAQKNAAPQVAAGDEDLPPIIKTPWKGDLDEMAKRRVVRVLVPFRRPEFFYMEGRPAGILQEAFQEVETVLNKKYKTTAANRILVALLPTPTYRLRERMAGGYADIAAAAISITE